MANKMTITKNGNHATINIVFDNLTDALRVKPIVGQLQGRSATWSGHEGWLGDHLPKLLHKCVGNCVVTSAPAEIIEKYNLELVTHLETVNPNWYEMHAGRAKIHTGYFVGDKIEGKTITGFGKSWIENGIETRYAYFSDYQSNRMQSGVSYEHGIQEWVA